MTSSLFFAAVVFSNLRVLTKMIVIAISSTNCFPLISADGFPGLCRAAAISHSPTDTAKPTVPYSPSAGRGRMRSEARFGGLSAERGLVGKGQGEKNPPGLLPKNTTRHLFSSAWSSPVLGSPGLRCPSRAPWEPGSPAAVRRSPRHARCPAASGNPPRHLRRTRGGCFPRNVLFLGLFSLFPPEGAAGEEADASWHSRSDFIPVAAVYAAVW